MEGVLAEPGVPMADLRRDLAQTREATAEIFHGVPHYFSVKWGI
jgi:hypothetical protein